MLGGCAEGVGIPAAGLAVLGPGTGRNTPRSAARGTIDGGDASGVLTGGFVLAVCGVASVAMSPRGR